MKILIKNGQIWYQNRWILGDLLIESGLIKEVKESHNSSYDSDDQLQVIDVKGKLIAPGFIDLHVHLREPGFEYKETIETGAKAAIKGGFTSIAAMPNTKPVIDQPELVQYLIEKGKEAGYAKVLPIGAITIGEQGIELADLEGMKEKGAVAFSDDGKGIQTAALMMKAMKKAQKLKIPIVAHVEDESFLNNGVIHDGIIAKKLGVPGIPSEAEYVQLSRDLLLAEKTGVHYHVCHVSTKESVQLIREAKGRGVNVTAEVTPHHLLLTEEDLKEPYPQYKMNPPLRSEADRQALIKGLIDGTIDIIATDHAPHSEEEKNRGIVQAPFGIVGLETAFPLLYTHLVKTNILRLEDLIARLTIEPSELFGLNSGLIEVGQPADITIIDLVQAKTVDASDFFSKGKNSPFIGWELYGWPVMTFVDGQIKWHLEEGLKNG